MFHIILIDTNKKLCKEWEKELKIIQSDKNKIINIKFSIYNLTLKEYLKKNKSDSIVSPANSFGIMDGGFDYYISEYYGGVKKFIPFVRKALDNEYCGIQNVGTSFIIDLIEYLYENKLNNDDNKNYPKYLIHTPTMRTPSLIKKETDIIYSCIWSILCSIRKHNNNNKNNINSVIITGLGTGAGGISEEYCAKQMILAFKHFIESPYNIVNSTKDDEKYGHNWTYAQKIQKEIDELIDNNIKK